MAQIDTQRLLDYLEDSGKFYFFDSESQGRDGDYGRMYAISIKPFDQKPTSFIIGANMQDKGMLLEAKAILDDADCIVGFYSKGHDVPLINTRLIRWGLPPLNTVHHIDMYYALKYKVKTGSKSQAHLLEFLGDTMRAYKIPVQKKMTVSPNVWSDLPSDYSRCIKILKDRCESDVAGLEALYKVTRHLIRDVKKG